MIFLFLAFVAAAFGQLGSITEFSVPTANSSPFSIALGPDGALWFAELGANKIGRITTSGSFTEFAIPKPASAPWGIAAGPDGLIWFVEQESGQIGKVTTGGVFTEYPLPSSASSPQAITAGPDGALWFTDAFTNAVGRITTSGSIIEYPIPTPNAFPYGIVAGTDGALWFTELSKGQIGRVTTNGIFTEYAVLTSRTTIMDIAAGPDGSLWFTEQSANKIGRIHTSGSVTEYAIPTADSYPGGIAAGPDGAIWFNENHANQIGRITAGGSITEFPVPTSGAYLSSLVSGPDGGVWFTEEIGNKIGRVDTGNADSLLPSLSITIVHQASQSRGELNGDLITVSNGAQGGITSGTVTVTDTFPAGINAMSMVGSGWNCTPTTCTTSNPLLPGENYLPISTTYRVAADAPSILTNQVTVSGGGSASSSASVTDNLDTQCSLAVSPLSVSVPATGTSTVEPCPNNSGQPNCGVLPEVPLPITVTANTFCGIRGGSLPLVVFNNTHATPQTYNYYVSAGGVSVPLTVTEAGSGNNRVYRETYALYEQLLGRDPDPTGFAFWTGSGNAGLGQMADSFLTSPEAFNNDFAVMAAYQAATGAPPSYAQYSAEVAGIRAGTQTIPGLFNSLFNDNFNQGALYQNLLNRLPGGADANCIIAGLTACFQIIIGYPNNTTPVNTPNNEFQSTGSYRSVDHTNALYLQLVYYVTVGRDPDPAGFAFWLSVANSGGPGLLAGYGTRFQILGPGTPNQGFIGSPEFQGLFAN